MVKSTLQIRCAGKITASNTDERERESKGRKGRDSVNERARKGTKERNKEEEEEKEKDIGKKM